MYSDFRGKSNVANVESTEISDVSERMRKSCGLRQNTLDSDFHSTKRLMPTVVEHRRASVTVAPKYRKKINFLLYFHFFYFICHL